MWWLKILGSILVILCTSLIGYKQAQKLKKRAGLLNKIILSTDIIAGRIRMETEEINSVLKRAFPTDIHIEKEGVWVENSPLTQEDISLINEFLRDIGMGDTLSQIKRCEAYKELFKKQLIKANTAVEEKYRLFCLCGTLSGVIFSFLWW